MGRINIKGEFMFEYISHNEEETKKIATTLASKLKTGDIVVLSGDLGSGKTKFTEGFLSFWNLQDEISSPTFTIVNEYDSGRLKLNHFDVYRVSDPDEIYAIGFDDYIFSDAVSIIEWANYIEDILPKEYLHIHIEKNLDNGENFRTITLTPYGERYNYIKELKIW